VNLVIINGDYLIEDCSYYKKMANQIGLGDRYIIVPAYGDARDDMDPLLWIRIIEKILL